MTSELPSWMDELAGDIVTREIIYERAKNIKGSLSFPDNVRVLLPDCTHVIGDHLGPWQFVYKGIILDLYIAQINTDNEHMIRTTLVSWCYEQLERHGLLYNPNKTSKFLHLKHTSFEDLVGIFVGE